MRKIALLAVGAALAVACNKQTVEVTTNEEVRDSQTFADISKAKVKHLSLDI